MSLDLIADFIQQDEQVYATSTNMAVRKIIAASGVDPAAVDFNKIEKQFKREYGAGRIIRIQADQDARANGLPQPSPDDRNKTVAYKPRRDKKTKLQGGWEYEQPAVRGKVLSDSERRKILG